ncbi:hypothetical protein PROFUN_00727 [Planoprotostelium fungivorum]|uniref:Uncharacterized protein n=1 Tax=Planoprotostelium fungivorum TaxID=1890364 RepID=A0A2P6NUA2_9EUKA|nr:hypothetical protein PROFUN_00727 [Planoprotostelium fungivorum]
MLFSSALVGNSKLIFTPFELIYAHRKHWERGLPPPTDNQPHEVQCQGSDRHIVILDKNTVSSLILMLFGEQRDAFSTSNRDDSYNGLSYNQTERFPSFSSPQTQAEIYVRRPVLSTCTDSKKAETQRATIAGGPASQQVCWRGGGRLYPQCFTWA